MKITARVNGEDQQLVYSLRNHGIHAKLIRNAVLVELPQEKGVTRIPKPVVEMQHSLLIDCAECGGAMTKTGSAIIVCGLSGKALFPYHVPMRGHLANEDHAYFAVPGAVVRIHAWKNDERVKVEKCEIEYLNRDIVKIRREIIWEGERNLLPMALYHYKTAIDAAFDKAHCYHCREAHFIRLRSDDDDDRMEREEREEPNEAQ